MTTARILPSLLLLALTLTLTVCAAPGPVGLQDGPPTVRGSVVRIQHSATASGILVEPGNGACGLRATADAETRYFRRSASGGLTPLGAGAASALAVGDVVAVYAEGPVLESCPMEGRASILILEPAPIDLALLPGRWVHAQEEDEGGVQVYRPEGSRVLSPRMFRQQYAFFEGGHAEALVPHPADAHYLAEGRWAATSDPSPVVRIRYEGRTDAFRIVELRHGLLRMDPVGAAPPRSGRRRASSSPL